MMVPPRKRKMLQSCSITTTLAIGNCIVEFPSDVDQEFTPDKLLLQVHQSASIRISVDTSSIEASGTPSPCNPGANVLPKPFSYQIINPKSLDKVNYELLECIIKLYKQELPAMRFAADTGKESDFLRNCTMSGKYCTLLMKKPGVSPGDPEVVVGAITYQILPTSTQYAEIPLAAVDQASQRQGLGKLLVRELARRLTDVGVLTLFCWGDQESEHFWNKQGFVKIAEVDAQGKPQKLRLKNEIRKSMSLPGNSALMVCNLPQVGTPPPIVNSGAATPLRNLETTRASQMVEKEVKPSYATTLVEAQQSPIAYSDVSDPCSAPPGSTLRMASRYSDVSPEQAAMSSFSPNSDSPSSKVKTNARGSSSKVTVVTNPLPGSKPSSAKSNRTLSFAGVDHVVSLENQTSESAPAASPGELVVIIECEKSGPVVNSSTESLCEKVSPAPSCETASRDDGESREPLSVQNIVAPVKKRPWRRTQCDSPKAAAAAQKLPQSTGIERGPEKENNEPARKDFSENEESDETLKAGLKRPRSEAVTVKTVGRRSVRRRRGDSPPTSNPLFQTPEPSVCKPAPKPEELPAAQKAEVAHYGPALNIRTVSATRDAKIVDCKQSMADESFSPSSPGDEHFISRLDKHGKDSSIRKRVSNRLVHVPEVGEDFPLASGYQKDNAKTTTPVVFLMNMPNDPKKRALAQLVEKLGGKVTGDGGECTHVVTSEVRRTLNFCTALCNGSWVVTPDWLKASRRHQSFVDEKSYLLRDKQFESKYKVSLATVIQTARRKPSPLFTGFSIYPTPHVEPPLNTISKLTQAAGGKILSSLDEALQLEDSSHAIVLACVEDEKESDAAVKAGLRTYTGEWFMQAIVRQRIDFSTKVLDDL